MKKKSGKFTILIIAIIAVGICVSGVLVAVIYNYINPHQFTYVTPATGDGTGYYRHCYAELNDEEKEIYSVILGSVYTMPESIEVPEFTNSSLDKIFAALSYDNPDLFCLGITSTLYSEKNSTFFKPEYTLTYESYTSRLTEMKNIASVIISAANQYTSDYEKELYVHDYIINHCTYTDAASSENANTAYGCLVEGKASCEGYSRAFQYILSALNINNRLVTGEGIDTDGNYIGHMWTLLYIDDQPYFTDITWDDPSSSGSVLRHTYFNITTEEMLLTHRNIYQELPLCTAVDYNYFTYENAVVQYTTNAILEADVTNALVNSAARGYSCAELKFRSSDEKAAAVKALFDTGVVYTAYYNTGLITDKNDAKVYYSADKYTNVLCLYY